MNNSKYNKEELKQLIEEGYTNKEIANILNVTEFAVGSIIRKLKIGRNRFKISNFTNDEFIHIINKFDKIKDIAKALGYNKVDGRLRKNIQDRCDELGIRLNITTKRKQKRFCLCCGKELNIA